MPDDVPRSRVRTAPAEFIQEPVVRPLAKKKKAMTPNIERAATSIPTVRGSRGRGRGGGRKRKEPSTPAEGTESSTPAEWAEPAESQPPDVDSDGEEII